MIKFYLKVIGRTVVFSILEMDEKQRAEDVDGAAVFVASNDFEIRTSACPELCPKSVCLRGRTKEQDDVVETKTFNSRDEALGYAGKVKFALMEWAARGGFFPNSSAEKEPADGIFEF